MTVLDAGLVAAAGKGERGAKERLLSLLAPMRSAVARRTMSRRFPLWEREDAEQVVSIACLRGADSCRDSAALPAFFAAVAYRDCLRERCSYHAGWSVPRSPAADAGTIADEEPDETSAVVPSAEEEAMRTGELARLHGAIAALPESLREVVNRRFGLDGKPPATLRQLAKESGVPFSTLADRERRALALLRDQMP